MKLLHADFLPGDSGSVKLAPEEEDDLWHAYNLIVAGDTVQSVTVRKFVRETASGGKDTQRIKLTLEIKVESVDYDREVMRIRGKNILMNQYVKIGQYHTLEIEPHRSFVLRKDVWDSMAQDILRQACHPVAGVDLAVIMMQEGLANLLLVGKSVTKALSRIATPIPRKRGAAIAAYESALKTFFENVLQALLQHVDFQIVRCLVIASPGFTKDQFHDYLLLEAERRQYRPIVENKSRIILANSTSGYKHSVKDVLSTPSVMTLIKDAKAAQEVQALKAFFDMLSENADRACYGPKHVEFAHEQLAIQTLLITDSLFRNSDIPTRKNYIALVESVKDSGGVVHVFSSMHASGEQLAQITGIAAILRFPLPELDDLEM